MLVLQTSPTQVSIFSCLICKAFFSSSISSSSNSGKSTYMNLSLGSRSLNCLVSQRFVLVFESFWVFYLTKEVIRFLNYRSNGESFESSSLTNVFYLLGRPSIGLKGSYSFFFLRRCPLILKFESFMCNESI